MKIERYKLLLVVFMIFLFQSLIETSHLSAGEFAYIANNDSNSVYVVNLSTYETVDTIIVGGRQYGIAICQDSSYVITTHSGLENDWITIINIPDNRIRKKIRLNLLTTPLGIVLTSDCTRAYVSAQKLNSVLVVDVFKEQIIDTIAVGLRVEAIDISPDGNFVYAGNRDSNSLSVIATETNTVINTIGVGSLPHGVAVTPDGKYVYVTNGGVTTDSTTWTVSVINTSTLTVIDEIAVGDYAFGIDITPDGRFAYLANARSHTVSVIDISSNSVISTINVWYRPKGIAIDSKGEFVYVSTDVGGRVQKISIADNEVVNTKFVAYGLLEIDTFFLEDIEVEPDTLIFERSALGDSVFKNLHVLNNGNANLIVNSLQITGPDAGSFRVDTLSFTVARGDSHVIPVRYSPLDTGLLSASLEIKSDLRSKNVGLLGSAYQHNPFVANPIQDFTVGEDFGSIIVALLDTIFNDHDLPDDSLRFTVLASSELITANITGDTLWLFSVADSNGMTEVVVVATDDSALSVSDTFNVTIVQVVGIEDDLAVVPEEFNLLQNYPNPFNPETVIEYALPSQSDVNLIIYNLLGEEIVRLINGAMSAGNHQVTWDASNFASGIYFYRLQAGNFIQTRKMVLLK